MINIKTIFQKYLWKNNFINTIHNVFAILIYGKIPSSRYYLFDKIVFNYVFGCLITNIQSIFVMALFQLSDEGKN